MESYLKDGTTSRLVRGVVEVTQLRRAHHVHCHSRRSDKTGSLQGNRKENEMRKKRGKRKKEKKKKKPSTAYQTRTLTQADQKSENLRCSTGRPAGFGPRIAAL